MTRDQIIMLAALISGKARQAIEAQADAEFPIAPPPPPGGFARTVYPAGRVVEETIKPDGSRVKVTDAVDPALARPGATFNG